MIATSAPSPNLGGDPKKKQKVGAKSAAIVWVDIKRVRQPNSQRFLYMKVFYKNNL
jgi:hypothetical protein